MTSKHRSGDQMAAKVSRQVTYSIRDVCHSDITSLAVSIPRAGETFSREWLITQQAAGNLDYIIAAWVKELPVGQGVILWGGYAIPELAADFPCTPVIRSVEVTEKYRGRGIGSAIVAELEARARVRGYVHTSLGIMPGNAHAENLWRYLGYREWEKGIVTATSIHERTDGREIFREEQFLPMRKRL
jgi:GNAT superfamily N-acetyltransferase